MSLPYSASIPAVYPEKLQECLRAPKYMRVLLEKDLKPRSVYLTIIDRMAKPNLP